MRSGRNFDDVKKAVQSLSAATAARSMNNIKITERMVKLLGLEPTMKEMPFIHVAGSKGKGTTCAYTAKFLQAAGLKVGLFTSPHLYDVRERFKVNYEMIPKELFTQYFFDIWDKQKDIEANAVSEFDRSASRSGFFRFTFYLALHAFAQEKVDVVVLETGLGGRIDSTNVVTPKVNAITSLGFEHTEILGNTIEEIAAEKAGIIKHGVPCFCDPQYRYPAALKVLEETALKVDTGLVPVDERIISTARWPPLAMEGEHVKQNAKIGLALARTYLQLPITLPLQSYEKEVLQTLTFEGRSQTVQVSPNCTFYLDGAHTPESMEAVANWFDHTAMESTKRGKRVINVLVFFTQRDPAKLFPALRPLRSVLHSALFVPVEFTKMPNEDKGSVVMNCKKIWDGLYPEVPSRAMSSLIKTADEYLDLVCTDNFGVRHDDVTVNVFCTGSLYLIGSVLKAIRNDFTPPGSPQAGRSDWDEPLPEEQRKDS